LAGVVESAAVTVKAVTFEPWLLVGAVKVTTEAALAPVVADTPENKASTYPTYQPMISSWGWFMVR